MIKKFWNWFWRPGRRVAWGATFIVGGMAGVFALGAFNATLGYTNRMEFCINCHVMESTVFPEYQASRHYANHNGVRVICSDCHVPRGWGAKFLRKAASVNELYHTAVGTYDDPATFEERRAELAERVWADMRANDSRECRGCHSFEAMAFELQAEMAQAMHPMAAENGMTCIDCHKGLVHKLPEGYE